MLKFRTVGSSQKSYSIVSRSKGIGPNQGLALGRPPSRYLDSLRWTKPLESPSGSPLFLGFLREEKQGYYMYFIDHRLKKLPSYGLCTA